MQPHKSHVVWGEPLSSGPDRDRWIDCVLGMVENADGDYLTAHYVFAKKVLRDRDALKIAVAFRHHALTREECERIADDWWEPTA